MVKMKALVAVMRKFLKMFFKVSVNKEGFYDESVFNCESQFIVAA